MTDITGQVAIVTGGGGSIGRATVHRLRAGGAHVVAVDVSLEAMASHLTEDLPGSVELLQGDVMDRELGPRAVALATEKFGRLDILVNNAGMGSDQVPIWEIDTDVWERDISVNLTSQFLMCKAAIPAMLANNYGRIINVASAAGMEGHALAGGYAAAKGAVITMTKTLGKELAKTGVIVNCIAPALINTGMLNQPWFTDQVRDTLLGRIPMGRLGEPEEVAEMIAYLASPAVTFTTGSVFDLSGGRATY